MKAKFILTLGLLLLSMLAFAQSSGGDFEITKHTIDNGGGSSANGDFEVTGTVGQHDASQQVSTGGAFRVIGGFWATHVEILFEDGFEDD